MDKPIEDTIKALLSFVTRQFYSNSFVLVLDAIMFHSVLSEEDLAHLLGIKRPELRSLITILLEDRIMARHSQQEFAFNSRSVKRFYYYIKYPQAIDAIKWKVHQIVAHLKDDLDKNSSPQGYICPSCSTRYSQLEAVALLNYERTEFVCSLCEEPLVEDDSGKRTKEKQNRLNRLMDQVQPIIDYLKKIDDNMIEENTFETALARLIPPQNNSVAQYTLNPRARKSKMFGPGDSGIANENSRRAGVKSQATLHVNITTQYDEMYQREQQERQAEEKRKQNALPTWHEQSTIGEKALGHLSGEDESGGVKIEGSEQMDGEGQEMGENGEEYAEDEYEQSISRPVLTEEQIKEREAERTLAEYYAQLAKKNADEEEDMDDYDEEEDVQDEDFEDVQDEVGNDTVTSQSQNTTSAVVASANGKNSEPKDDDDEDDDDMVELEDIELETVKQDQKEPSEEAEDEDEDMEDEFEDV